MSGCKGLYIVVLCCLVLITPLVAIAVPVEGELLPLVQPDGTRFQVRIWGDEFYQVVESVDGYTLVRDPYTQVICYARLSANGDDLISTGFAAHLPIPDGAQLKPHIRINKTAVKTKAEAAKAAFIAAAPEGLRSSKAPSTGEVQGICLIVDFSDDPWTIPASEVNDFCNLVGYNGFGNNGSVRDYYYDVSGGLLIYTSHVPTVYYRAPHPKSYYNDPNVTYGVMARELVRSALVNLNNSGFDFSTCDADGDFVVDAVNCYYAGYSNSAWSEGLWPHSWTISYFADGVRTGKYQITDMQGELRLGTFCHENGHMLFDWPDLYDYGYDSSGVGRFCIMCSIPSGIQPQHPCAPLKYAAGWCNTTIVNSSIWQAQLPAAANVAYKYEHPWKGYEYYLVENRQRSGRDQFIPDSGLAIWHVDTHGNNDNQQMTEESHYYATLVQADGRWDLEHDQNNGDSTDLWAAPDYTVCGRNTYPNTKWWDGTSSFLDISGISESKQVMTANFGPIDCNTNGITDSTEIAANPSLDCNGDLVIDECQLEVGDCNNNGTLDFCDISSGVSEDCNNSAVPDECELDGNDCNANLIPDDCESAWLIGSSGHPDDVDACSNGMAGFSVTTEADSPEYQWYTGRQVPLSDIPGKVSGATSSTLTIHNLVSSDEGFYWCEVSDGCLSRSSQQAQLRIITDPVITGWASGSTTCEGALVTLSIDHLGLGDYSYDYIWRKDGVILQNQPGARLISFDAVTVGDDGVYTCEVRSEQCGYSYESAGMPLNVLGARFVEQPAPLCLESDDTATISAVVDSDYAITGYRWQKWTYVPSLDEWFWLNVAGPALPPIPPLVVSPPLSDSEYRLGVYVADACWSYSQTVPLTVGQATGDLDGDGDVDLVDMARFAECFSVDTSVYTDCTCAKLGSGDAIIGLDDWLQFEAKITGPQ